MKRTRLLDSVIEGFETRFGDGASVCEVDCEGPSRQPRGYTKVRTILLSLVLFCPLLYLCTKSTHSDNALALTPLSLSLSLFLSLSLYVTHPTDPDCGYLSRCLECSYSPWYPPNGGRSSLESCEGHVGRPDQRYPGWVNPCAPTSRTMASQATVLRLYLRLLLALSPSRVPIFVTKRSPCGGCAWNHYRRTRTLLMS